MSHPDPNGPPDLTPIRVGDVFENPVTGERATILELPWTNPEGRVVAELTALVGARVAGEHRHPSSVERFTALEGELTVTRDGRKSTLREGETAVVEPGGWHDWWNAGDRDARARVEVTPGERFAYMIETFFGLARLGHTNAKGIPDPLQLALSGREFSDAIVLRSPPPAVQRVLFGALAPLARWRGYRPTYPQISRTVLAPRDDVGAGPEARATVLYHFRPPAPSYPLKCWTGWVGRWLGRRRFVDTACPCGCSGRSRTAC